MDASRAINALAPFVALAKSATSPRAAVDLITQATTVPNTFVFAELLHQPNIQALAGNEEYSNFYQLLEVFAWGTWETYRNQSHLPPLSDAQITKLRLLSLLTIASERPSKQSQTPSNLSYTSLCQRLELQSSLDLEHLVTQAIYDSLITGTLNPAAQTIVITSVAPLRDPAPGSVSSMIAELAAWQDRCGQTLADLEAEIAAVKEAAHKRQVREQKAERQIQAVTEQAEKVNAGTAGTGSQPSARPGPKPRSRLDELEDDVGFAGDGEAMDVDTGMGGSGARKRSGGGSGGGNAGGRTLKSSR